MPPALVTTLPGWLTGSETAEREAVRKPTASATGGLERAPRNQCTDRKAEADRVKFSLRHGVQRSVGAGPRQQGSVNNAKTR